MKAVISNRIYLKGDIDVLNGIKAQLTYNIERKIQSKFGSAPKTVVEVIKNYRIFNSEILTIPRGRLDLIPKGYEIVHKDIEHYVPFPDPKLQLRPDQKEIYDQVNSGCFINALVGWGKTFTALHIAHKLSQKTLIVVHNKMLLDQWVEEVHTLFGFYPGIITSGKYDIEDHFIVVSNVQTMLKYADSLSKEFGTIILDEAHHCPAETFSEILDKSYAKYRIGLSGTMVRKDGKHILFRDYFGATVFKPPQYNTENPDVEIIQTGTALQGNSWATKINNLLYDPDYQKYIALLAAKKISEGHSVLIIADRVEFLYNIKNILGDSCLLVVGSSDLSCDRDEAKELINSGAKKAIAGSRQIFSEGISINRLSCVILATPIGNESLLEQIIGRIMRIYPGKPTPLVVDVQFCGPSDRKQNTLRKGFYLKKGWNILGT